MFDGMSVLIKGAGDIATGVAARLWRSGFTVVLTELAQPLAIRRTVAFAEAVYDCEVKVEEITAIRTTSLAGIQSHWHAQKIPVLIGHEKEIIATIKPSILVDAILAKHNTGTHLSDAPFVVGLGPGFVVGQDVHAIVETHRGHYLGRVLWSGSALPDTGTPGDIANFSRERVIYAPGDGIFKNRVNIGAMVKAGEIIGYIGQIPVFAPIAGVLRGLIHNDVFVKNGLKIGDIDPRALSEHCRTISDKALSIGGGVLEAALMYLRKK